MEASTNLSAKQRMLLFDFQRSLPPNKTIYLDLSNPEVQEVIRLTLKIAGKTSERYPKLYKELNSGKSLIEPKELDTVHLVDIGRTSSGKATATIWTNSDKATLICGGNLILFNADTGEILAEGDNSANKSGFVNCPTRGATAKQASANLALLYVGFTLENDGDAQFFAYAYNAPGAAREITADSDFLAEVEESGIQANITAPVSVSNPEIHIAVGRTEEQGVPNSDYIYYEPNGHPEGLDAYLIVPFTGDVALSGSIDLSALTANNFQTNIVYDGSGGEALQINRATAYTTDTDMVAAFSVGSAPNILSWDFPYDGKNHGDNGYATTKSIVYDRTSLVNQINCYFYFAFENIPLMGGNFAPPFFVCSKNSPEEKSINCTEVGDLYFWYHCLAEGTKVTMDDGTRSPIEILNETHRVKSGTKGNSFAIDATVLGLHDSDKGAKNPEKVYSLTTTNGKSIIATANHIIFMKEGKCRMIAHLVAGDPILTDEGPSRVASNEEIEYHGMFYGLALGNSDEKGRKDFPHNHASFYANGILTGDQQAMRYHAKKAYDDLDYILPKINSEVHIDYQSAVEDKRFN